MTEQYTQRIYVDPERLLKLKTERKPLKLVPSVFEPPEYYQEQESTKIMSNQNTMERIEEDASSQRSEFLKYRNAKIQFIVSLLPEIKRKHIYNLEQGDCINFHTDDKWLILEGQLKISNINNFSYNMSEGYLFFLHKQTSQKIKEVICVKPSRVLRIPYNYYKDYLKSYIFMKNSQKIKYLKYCPFFIWSEQLSQDLATCIEMKVYEKEQIIYKANSNPDSIFFVKEGIVLLERNIELNNYVVKDYEAHYQKNQISSNEAVLVVKKGMVFGIDGILLKEVQKEDSITIYEDPVDEMNSKSLSKFQSYEIKSKKNTRVYTARTIGRSQVYILKKQVLEALFNISDMLNLKNTQKDISQKQLSKICSDYANMISRHKSLPKIQKILNKNEMVLPPNQANKKMEEKILNAKRIRGIQQKTKLSSIANIIADPKIVRLKNICQQKETNENSNIYFINQNINSRVSSERNLINDSIFAFPSLSRKFLSQKKKSSQESPNKKEKQLMKAKHVQEEIFKNLKKYEIKNPQRDVNSPQRLRNSDKKMILNIRSYRSLISTLD